VEGTGGSFSFYDLGEPLLLENKYINEAVSVEKIREYVWFMETQEPLPQRNTTKNTDEPYLLGCHNRTAYYFYYEKDRLTTLDRTFLKSIKTKADAYLIYADINTFSDKELERHRLIFKKIPRDIAKL
jgi:adenine-specific DNA-methyltransferase